MPAFRYLLERVFFVYFGDFSLVGTTFYDSSVSILVFPKLCGSSFLCFLLFCSLSSFSLDMLQVQSYEAIAQMFVLPKPLLFLSCQHFCKFSLQAQLFRLEGNGLLLAVTWKAWQWLTDWQLKQLFLGLFLRLYLSFPVFFHFSDVYYSSYLWPRY